MHLYHLLARERLEEKLAYARENDGRLMLTGHAPSQDSADGAISRYLHLLPDLVGGMDFASGRALTAIRATLRDDARRVTLRGPRASLDLAAAAVGADVLHVRWEEPGLVFQEWLLLNERAVAAWTSDPDVLRADYLAQRAALAEGRLDRDRWFYPELDLASQRASAALVGHRLGFAPLDAVAATRQVVEDGMYHLGVSWMSPTKHLFFAGPALLALARRLATPEVPTSPWLAHVPVECGWLELDDALEAAAVTLAAALDGLDVAGPLELGFPSPPPLAGRPAEPGRAWLGVRVRSDAPAPVAVTRVALVRIGLHEGSQVGLEATVRSLVSTSPATLAYALHRFEGARHVGNVVGIDLGR